jgi:hemolysin activation/secretion protein
LNKRNSIALRNQTFVLQSSSYLTNELFRFGGINSVRGFNENTLQANFVSALLSEYRYTLSNTLYLHSVFDYGYFQDQTTNINGNLLGIGFGFGLLNKNGLLNFVYANGTTNDQAIKLNNSIVQISLKTIF